MREKLIPIIKLHFKTLLIHAILFCILSHGYSQNNYYDDYTDSIGKLISQNGDSIAIGLFQDLKKTKKLSYDFFENMYNLANQCKRTNQWNISHLLLKRILESEIVYPNPEDWQRLSSKSYLILGQYYEKAGQTERAIENYINSAGCYEKYYGENNFNIPIINHKIALLNKSIFQYEEAIKYYKKNIYLLDQRGEYEEARILKYISHCYKGLEEYDIALSYIDGAMAIHEKSGLSRKEDLPSIYNAYGIIFEFYADWDSALYYYHKAKFIQQEIDGTESVQVAFYCNNIGNVFLAMPQLDSALYYYKESLSVRELLLPARNEQLVHSYYNVGYAYSKLGHLDSALIYCNKSIASNLGIGIDSIPLIFPDEEDPISEKDYIISLTDKAEYYFTLFQQNGNSRQDIQQAFYSVNRALNYSNNIVKEISNYYSDLSWINFEKRLLDLVTIIYHHYQEEINSETNMSLIGSGIKKNRIHNKYYNINNSSRKSKDQVSRDLLNYNRIQLNQFLSEKGISTSIQSNRSNLNQLNNPITYASDYEVQVDNLVEKVQEKINNNQAIVDYLLCDSNLIINVITKKEIIKKVIYAPDLETCAYRFTSDLKKVNDIYKSSQKMFEYLIEPIIDNISEKEIIIIPDDFLYRIPYEAILLTNDKSEPKFLISSFTISYGFSVQNLIRENKPTLNDFEFTYTGWTPYTEEPKEFILTNRDDTLHLFKYLPEAFNEVKMISDYYCETGNRNQIFTGKNGSLQNLINNRNNSSIIHFATHNIVDFETPLLSHLLLYFDDRSSDKFENILFLPLVPFLGLKANLVIMDCCETGNGKLVSSEGLLSMAHAMCANDVSSVIFSMWNESDDIAKLFMTKFVSFYNQSQKMDEALQKVKLEFINSPLNHPFFWAGIVGYQNYFNYD